VKLLKTVDIQNAMNGPVWPIGCNFPTPGDQGFHRASVASVWFTDCVPVAHMKFRQHLLAQSVKIGSSNLVLSRKTSFLLFFFRSKEEKQEEQEREQLVTPCSLLVSPQ
jgi:hypothetical protein